VISSVAPKVINAIVDAGAAYLEKRKTDLTGSASARGASEIYAFSADVPPRPQLGCVAFARAHFGEALAPDGVWTSERLKKFGFSTAPSLYAEFQVLYSRDMRAVRLQPVYLEFNKTSAARIGSKKKNLLFTGFLESPFGPLAEMETKRFGAFQLFLDGVTLGSVMNAAALAASTSQWIPLPQPEAFESPGSLADKPRKGWTTVPVSVFMTAQESEEGGNLLLKATETYKASKDDLATKLSEWLTSSLTPKKDDQGQKAEDDEAGGNGGEQPPR
jgi:hypothetical protein